MWPWKNKNKGGGSGNEKETKEEYSPEYDSLDFDLNGIGIIDESQIVVNDSDLNDPHLLSELNKLHNNEGDLLSFEDFEEESNVTVHQEEIVSVPIDPEVEIVNLKQRALALNKEGKKSEALALLREAKMLQNSKSSEPIKQASKPTQRPPPSNPTPTPVPPPAPPVAAVLSSQNLPPPRPPSYRDVQSEISSPALVKVEKNVMVTSNSASKKQVATTTTTTTATREQITSTEVNNRTRSSESSKGNYSIESMSLKLESTPLETQRVYQNDPFAPLENAINEAMKTLLHEAKEFKDTNPQKAAEKFRKYKSLKDELLVVASRKAIPGALPPLFKWNTVSKETVVEDPSLGDDQLKLEIGCISDLEAVLQDHSSRTLSLSYTIGVIKDNPEFKTKQVRYKNSEKVAEFHEENIFTFRRKGSTVESQFSRKKAIFTLTLHRGMFQSDLPLGIAKVNLSDLLTKCKAGGFVQLLDPSGKKTIGGRLEVYFMLRRPISTPEVKLEIERDLVIQDWPAIIDPQTQQPPSASMSSLQQTNPPTSTSTSASASTSQTMSSEMTTAPTSAIAPPRSQNSTIDFSLLSDLEKNDPLNLGLLVSNDVLENEISSTEAAMAACRDPDIIGDLQIKLMLLQGKLAVLVNQVQTETLSLEDYIALLKQRVESDKKLAVYCNQSDRREEAVQVMKRIRIMQNEIASVEQASGEES